MIYLLSLIMVILGPAFKFCPWTQYYPRCKKYRPVGSTFVENSIVRLVEFTVDSNIQLRGHLKKHLRNLDVYEESKLALKLSSSVFNSDCTMQKLKKKQFSVTIGSFTVDKISSFYNQFQKWFQKWGLCDFYSQESYKFQNSNSTLIAPLWNCLPSVANLSYLERFWEQARQTKKCCHEARRCHWEVGMSWANGLVCIWSIIKGAAI